MQANAETHLLCAFLNATNADYVTRTQIYVTESSITCHNDHVDFPVPGVCDYNHISRLPSLNSAFYIPN